MKIYSPEAIESIYQEKMGKNLEDFMENLNDEIVKRLVQSKRAHLCFYKKVEQNPDEEIAKLQEVTPIANVKKGCEQLLKMYKEAGYCTYIEHYAESNKEKLFNISIVSPYYRTTEN